MTHATNAEIFYRLGCRPDVLPSATLRQLRALALPVLKQLPKTQYPRDRIEAWVEALGGLVTESTGVNGTFVRIRATPVYASGWNGCSVSVTEQFNEDLEALAAHLRTRLVLEAGKVT